MLPGKSLTYSDVLAMVRRRIWLIAIPPVLTLFGALVYSSNIHDVYQSDMLIAVVPQRVPDNFVRSTVTLKTEERIEAITVEVMSRTNLEELIEEFDLYSAERAVLPMEDVVRHMRNSIQTPLEVRRGQYGLDPPHAFHVKFTYPDPEIAARVTQRIGSLIVEQNVKDRGALAEATDKFLEAQLDEARRRLESQERRLEAFRQRYGNELPTQLQSNLQVVQSTQLQVQAVVESIARDRDRRLMLERLMRDAEREPATVVLPPQPGATQAATAQSAQQQLASARAELARLEQRLRPEHPDVIRARRLVAELEPQAAQEVAQAAAGDAPPVRSIEDSQRRDRLRTMAVELESLERQMKFKEGEEQRLRGVLAEYQRRIEAVPGIESEFVALTRDYDTQQAAYRELLGKREASKVAVDLERQQIGQHFRILDPAVVPVHPVPSLRPRINAAGLAVGLILGLGIAALLEFKDSSFRTDADVLDALALPVMAVVPLVETSTERQRGRRRRLALASAGVAAIALGSYVTWSLKLWKSVL
jgi:polysaccharide chain length determinant protein (PEP-CTERM system associated)